MFDVFGRRKIDLSYYVCGISDNCQCPMFSGTAENDKFCGLFIARIPANKGRPEWCKKHGGILKLEIVKT